MCFVKKRNITLMILLMQELIKVHQTFNSGFTLIKIL